MKETPLPQNDSRTFAEHQCEIRYLRRLADAALARLQGGDSGSPAGNGSGWFNAAMGEESLHEFS